MFAMESVTVFLLLKVHDHDALLLLFHVQLGALVAHEQLVSGDRATD